MIVYGVKKVPTYPKEWKVFSINRPLWERNDPELFFENERDATVYAKRLTALYKDKSFER